MTHIAARASIHPVSPAQRALWLIFKIAPESPAYNIMMPARILSGLDIPALRRAFHALFRRHEMLRATFDAEDGELVYRIHDEMPLPFEEVDISGLDEPLVRPRLIEASHRPFDLETGPVARVELFHRGEGEHYLLFTIHHIVTDLVTFVALLDELRALYAAERTGKVAELPPITAQYHDFVRWQSELAAGPEGEKQWAYWQQKLGGELPMLNLPLDRARPPMQTFSGAAHLFEIPDELYARLRALTKSEGVTNFVTLLTVFAVLLQRYTGQDDLIIGSPVPGRQGKPELSRVMGYLVNVLALRADLSGNPTFRELLRRTLRVVKEGRANQGYPFPLLVDKLDRGHDRSRSPIYQVVFTLQKVTRAKDASFADTVVAFALPVKIDVQVDLGGLILDPVGVPQEEGQQELALHMFEIGGKLLGEIKYNTDLFVPATIERLADHFRVLLEEITADPDQPVLDYSMLTADERHTMLVQWNDTQIRWGSSASAHEIIEAQAKRSPHAIAAISGGSQLTYEELDLRSNAIAHKLRELGVGRDTLVGLFMERGLPLLTSILAVFKAGGAYIPIDPDYPPHRVHQILSQSRARHVVLTRDLRTKLDLAVADTPAEERPSLLSFEGLLENPRTESLTPLAEPGDLAYVIYTSGSTGLPKGAMVEHRGMVNHLFAKIHDLHLTASDIVAQTASQCFDISVWQLLAALLVGGQVIIFGNEIANDPRLLFDHVAAGRISVLETVPSFLRMVLEDVESRGARRPNLTALRWLVPTGEALPPELCRRWLACYPQVALVNAYGPTECSDDVSHHPIFTPPGADITRLPIGRPIANMRLYVLNPRRKPVPIGVAGELYVGGIGVGRGYLHDPARTADAFSTDPFDSTPPGRLYKTGDLARFLPDGAIEFLGRVDHQVKIRGFRIELGEIEALLAKHPAVRDTVVLARQDTPGDVRLVAYVVADGDPQLAATLKRYVGEHLPEYMVPAAVVVLDAMPLTPNLKVDRRALPAPDWSQVGRKVAYVAPRGEVEELVAGIWRDVLGLHEIGANDDFFDLGGHSLLAVQLVMRIRDSFHVDLPLRAIFDAPTVTDQARLIARRERDAAPAPTDAQKLTLVPDVEGRHEPFPLTDLQQAYWLGQTGALDRGNAPAMTYIEVDVQNLDLDRFHRAFARLIERHDMLRAIVRADGQQQILERTPPLAIEVLDLRGWSESAAEARIEAVRHHMSREGTRTDQWPLFQVKAHRLSDELTKVHFSFPLLLGDAQSYEILNRDLERFYRDPEAQAPGLGVSYRDHVVRLAELSRSGGLGPAEDYWRSRLPTLPPAPEMPLARAPAAVAESRFTRRSGKLAAEPWSRLKKRAARAGLTPTAAVCAAYAEVISRWSKTSHFTLNVLYQSRPSQQEHPDIEQVIGNFSTTILLEVDNRFDGTFEARARRLQTQLWSDMEHAQVSGVQVIREMARTRGSGGGTAMPVVFASTLHMASGSTSEPHDLLGRQVAEQLQTPHVWIDHQVSEKAGELCFHWDVVRELFPEAMVDAMIDAYVGLLSLLSDGGGFEETSFALLPPEQEVERNKVNATAAPVSSELLSGLFAAQAQREPDRIAVIDPRRRLTYGELARRVNQVGRRLRELSSRPNTLVAVVMKKGWEQVVATLGIQTAGAAYLPIDPDLPAERIAYLLRNGEVRIALTQPGLKDRIPWPDFVLPLAVDDTTFAAVEDGPLEPVQSPTDLAYVIFTSGSTGAPKGVMIDHRGAVNTVLDLQERFGVGPNDRVLALSSLSFDLSVYDIFGLLSAGGAIVLPDAAAARDPAHWAKLLVDEGVTLWNSVPALMQLLVEHAAGRESLSGHKLRTVMMSGDWIPVALPGRVKGLFGDIDVISLGGATEASIWSILYPIHEVDPAWKSIPYGRPMKNQSFHVLNDRLEPCPVWVVGELYIGGIGLAKGYWRDEQKTHARFITHPRTGERLYRTGDLGKYLPGGDIEFLGREDFQVKIQGYRIELGEIEHALDEHPMVRLSVVSAIHDASGARRLVGYVVPRGETGTLHQAELRSFLLAKLPEYMVPTTFVELDALPLSSNGKVDRQALPAPGQATQGRSRAFIAPRSVTERALVQIWEGLLGVSPVGIEDGFFDLGGNSFVAVRLMAQIEKLFQRSLPLSALLEGPTVKHLAALLDERGAPVPFSCVVAIQPGGSKRPFFCVHPVGGNVLCYADLARRLGTDRPFYGIQAPGLDGERAPFERLTEMAAHYVEAVRSVQPEGPYLLGGWSMGGVIAFEMAQQLRKLGHEVAELILIDSHALSAGEDLDEARLLGWFLRDLAGGAGEMKALSDAELGVLEPEARLDALLSRAREAGVVSPDIGLPELGRLLRVFTANTRALHSYRPRRYEGRAVVFEAEQRPGAGAASTWAGLSAEPVEAHSFAGDHYTMLLPPSIDRLAGQLQRCLDRAD